MSVVRSSPITIEGSPVGKRWAVFVEKVGFKLETCESEISVQIESRIEWTDSRSQVQC